MLISIIMSLSPFVLNAVMGVIKWLSDLQEQSSKRFFLALFSLFGVVAFSASTGNPVDPNSIANLFETMTLQNKLCYALECAGTHESSRYGRLVV